MDKYASMTPAQLGRMMAETEIESVHDAIAEETVDDRWRATIPLAATRALHELWFAISEQCSVTPRHAASFVEDHGGDAQRPAIYACNRAGLFSQLGPDAAPMALLESFSAADHMEWDRAWCAANLDFLRLKADDADRIMRAALLAYGVQIDDEERQLQAGAVPPYLDPSHPRYAPKLAAAVSAWLAVGDPPAGKTPKQALTAWLIEHGAPYGLTGDGGETVKEAVSVCATVANWRTGGGAPKTPGA